MTGSEGRKPPLRVALLGCGTVGTEVARLLVARADLLADRAGRDLELVGVAVRDASRDRRVPGVPHELFTQDALGLVSGADVVVEAMGGLEPARSLLGYALEHGTCVVTANKQLIAAHGLKVEKMARRHGVSLDYEAAVAAAVPVLRVVRESLAGDEITQITGILNGSTNFVLDMVARQGVAFADAVDQAGRLGYLEADPTEDLEGIDAAAKIVILARLAWGGEVTLDDVDRQGISGLTDEDFKLAAEDGTVIKLIASATPPGDGPDEPARLSVQPVALPAQHPLAAVADGGNGILVEAASAGTLELYGAGAGGEETASAMLGDLVAVARRR